MSETKFSVDHQTPDPKKEKHGWFSVETLLIVMGMANASVIPLVLSGLELMGDWREYISSAAVSTFIVGIGFYVIGSIDVSSRSGRIADYTDKEVEREVLIYSILIPVIGGLALYFWEVSLTLLVIMLFVIFGG